MTSTTRIMLQHLFLVVALASGALAGAVQQELALSQMVAQFDSPAFKVISDEDRMIMQHVKTQISDNFLNFKDIDEVHKFLDKVKLLVQKHPKNVAFAQGDLKELQKFLSEEMVTRLIRVDTTPFEMPIGDDRIMFAQRAVDDDELTRKLFGGPLRMFVESKKKHDSRTEDHRESNFFSNFWCKISGNCNSN